MRALEKLGDFIAILGVVAIVALLGGSLLLAADGAPVQLHGSLEGKSVSAAAYLPLFLILGAVFIFVVFGAGRATNALFVLIAVAFLAWVLLTAKGAQ